MISEIAHTLQTTCGNYSRADGFNMIAHCADVATVDARNNVDRGDSQHLDRLVAYGIDEEQNAAEELMGCLKARSAGGGFEGAVAFHPTQDPINNVDGTCHAMRTGSKGGCATVAVAFAQNTRDELREMAVVGALSAQPGMKQTSYIRQQMQVRRLTPTECERLQGFTTRIERVIITVCLDHQSGNVNVGLKCLKLPSSALIAEESESQEAVSSVKRSSKSDQENHGNAVVLHVQQSHETTLQRILSAGRLTYSANGADQLNLCPHLIPSGDIARGIARLRLGLETLARNGKAASQVSEMLFTLPANGRWCARWFGQENSENASDAETCRTEDITFITSNHSPPPRASEPTQQTWLYSALSAIGLFIPEGTFSESFAEVVIDVESGHTLIPWRGKMASDGPRYKALGNSMAVPVMRWIGERIARINADL